MQERFAYKMRVLQCLNRRLQHERAAGRHVAIVGDFNISPQPIDHCDPGPDFVPKRRDRRWLAALLSDSHVWRASETPVATEAIVAQGQAAADSDDERLQETLAVARTASAELQAVHQQAETASAKCVNCAHQDEVAPAVAAALRTLPAGGTASRFGADSFSSTAADSNCAHAGSAAQAQTQHMWLPCGGFTDTFRAFHPQRAHIYTCWNTATGARNNNWGTRIDLILTADPVCLQPGTSAPQLQLTSAHDVLEDGGTCAAAAHSAQSGDIWQWRWRDAAVAADINPEHLGSDHAPAWLEVNVERMAPIAAPTPRSPLLRESSRALFAANGKQASLARLWKGAARHFHSAAQHMLALVY